jgi:type III secretory pathway component EscT
MMWVRWTLPRLRIDQVLTTCLKYCVPLAAFCFIGALLWTILGIPFANDLAPNVAGAKLRGTVRESWTSQPAPVETSPAGNALRGVPDSGEERLQQVAERHRGRSLQDLIQSNGGDE